MSPRVSLIVPVGDEERGLGSGRWGLQFNLPVSKQVGDFYLHGNAGVTWLPSAAHGSVSRRRASRRRKTSSSSSPFSPAVPSTACGRCSTSCSRASSAGDEDVVAASATDRETVFIISPGVRGGWNLGDKQIVVGLAFPVFRARLARRSAGVFGYFSYELPF